MICKTAKWFWWSSAVDKLGLGERFFSLYLVLFIIFFVLFITINSVHWLSIWYQDQFWKTGITSSLNFSSTICISALASDLTYFSFFNMVREMMMHVTGMRSHRSGPLIQELCGTSYLCGKIFSHTLWVIPFRLSQNGINNHLSYEQWAKLCIPSKHTYS